MARETVPPVPFKVPFLDDNGYVSLPWSQFLTQLYARIGGPKALSNLELEDIQVVDISDLEDTVAALEVTVNTQNSNIEAVQLATAENTSALDDLNQGRQV